VQPVKATPMDRVRDDWVLRRAFLRWKMARPEPFAGMDQDTA
jgi:hypothetical protein